MAKLLFLSTPVGALGSGEGGGVELTIFNVACALINRGHQIKVVAPFGSSLSTIDVENIPGNLQIPAQTQARDTPICLPNNSVLANMWSYAYQVQNDWDLIVNFAFDWLPFYLTPFFATPIAHLISMGSMTKALDEIMSKVATNYPHSIGVHTQSQADTFPFAKQCNILGNGIDLSLYEFNLQPENVLVWVGRIAKEKALEDAVEASQITGIPLRIFGKIQDENYWQKIHADFPDAPIQYLGFLTTEELQKQLNQCRGLLMTTRCLEAFGNVVIEALACGVPVIAYNRGGPSEIVRHGKTGFLVEPDSVSGLVTAINRLDEIDRRFCRQQVEEEYSLKALGDRFENWLYSLIKRETK